MFVLVTQSRAGYWKTRSDQFSLTAWLLKAKNSKMCSLVFHPVWACFYCKFSETCFPEANNGRNILTPCWRCDQCIRGTPFNGSCGRFKPWITNFEMATSSAFTKIEIVFDQISFTYANEHERTTLGSEGHYYTSLIGLSKRDWRVRNNTWTIWRFDNFNRSGEVFFFMVNGTVIAV